jgi:hypothetical protein
MKHPMRRLQVGERVLYCYPTGSPERVWLVTRVTECSAALVPETRETRTMTVYNERAKRGGVSYKRPLETPIEKEVPEPSREVTVSPTSFMERAA